MRKPLFIAWCGIGEDPLSRASDPNTLTLSAKHQNARIFITTHHHNDPMFRGSVPKHTARSKCSDGDKGGAHTCRTDKSYPELAIPTPSKSRYPSDTTKSSSLWGNISPRSCLESTARFRNPSWSNHVTQPSGPTKRQFIFHVFPYFQPKC